MTPTPNEIATHIKATQPNAVVCARLAREAGMTRPIGEHVDAGKPVGQRAVDALRGVGE